VALQPIDHCREHGLAAVVDGEDVSIALGPDQSALARSE
jgi:hypothetical protein